MVTPDVEEQCGLSLGTLRQLGLAMPHIIAESGGRLHLRKQQLCSNVLDEILSVAKYGFKRAYHHGEAGTGKEKILTLIQKNSARKMQPF